MMLLRDTILCVIQEFLSFFAPFACCRVDVIYSRSSSERKGVETRPTAAKRGLFHRIHDRLKVTTHDTHSVQKNATKVCCFVFLLSRTHMTPLTPLTEEHLACKKFPI